MRSADRVGRMLADLHCATELSGSAVDPWYVERVGRDRWVELVGELRLSGAGGVRPA